MIAPQTFHQIFNALAPADGPKTVPVELNFATDAFIDVDLFKILAETTFQFAQSVYIDNRDNPVALTLLFEKTLQRIICDPLTIQIFPIIASNPCKFRASTTAGATVRAQLQLLNVPMPLTQWGPISASVTPIGGGNWTDRSGNTTAASVQMMAANAARSVVMIQNPQAAGTSIWINWGAAAQMGTDSIEIFPGGNYTTPGGMKESPQAINVIAAGIQPFIAKEM